MDHGVNDRGDLDDAARLNCRGLRRAFDLFRR